MLASCGGGCWSKERCLNDKESRDIKLSVRLDTDIPYGNAADVEITEEEGRPVVSFAADPHGGPVCMWFCFRLSKIGDILQGKTIKVVMKHFTNILGGHTDAALVPVIKYDGRDWDRLPPGIIEELPDGRHRQYWEIDAPDSFADIALCYPYGRPEIDVLLRETGGYWKADTIGVSQSGRGLVRLSNRAGNRGDTCSGVFIIARQHSGEVPGSWVLDGLLRRMALADDSAPLTWVIPLADIDGVEQGDYGKDKFPWDLNRGWSAPGVPSMRHEAHAYEIDMHRWVERCRPLLALDLHAPGARESEGVYAFMPQPRAFPEHYSLSATWADRFASALGTKYAKSEFKRVANYRSRWDSPGFGSFCRQKLNLSVQSLEIPYGMINDLVLTREHYREIGRILAEVILENQVK